MVEFSPTAALIIIDVQSGLDDPSWGARNNPTAEENMAALLAAWRETRRPVYHIQHMSQRKGSPLEPGKPGNQIKEVVRPLESEPVIQKRVNSAFIGTDLETRLRAGGSDQLVIAGLTTEHCVSTTVRMAANLGFVTTVASDATAAFDTIGPDGKRYTAEQVHEISLATLHDEFATVMRSSEILDAISPVVPATLQVKKPD